MNNVQAQHELLNSPGEIVASNSPASSEVEASGLKESIVEKWRNKNSSLQFEQNMGQVDHPGVHFKVRDAQATHFFLPTEIRSAVRNVADSLQAGYSMQFVGALADVQIEGMYPTKGRQGKRNYILEHGSFPNVPEFGGLRYQQLWKGVDAQFYEQDGGMKYDYIVQPGADPTQIHFRFDGADSLRVNTVGELEFATAFGTLQKGVPYTYQWVDGEKVPVDCRYQIEDGIVSFELGAYDNSHPLIIDPIALKYSTYLGGDGYDEVYDIAVSDNLDQVYITGYTDGLGFPATNFLPTPAAEYGFVTCLSKDGTTVLWSTIIDGIDLHGVAVDAAGDVYLGGQSSAGLPTSGTVSAYSTNLQGARDFAVLRLDPSGSVLKYGTYFGGTGNDGRNYQGEEIVVRDGKVSMMGTATPGMPTTANAYEPINTDANAWAWFTINTNIGGTAGLEYATYLHPTGVNADGGGDLSDIEMDAAGNIYLSGHSRRNGGSHRLPTTANALATSAEASLRYNNISFLMKFNTTGQLVFSSFIMPFEPGAGSSTNEIGGLYSHIDVSASGDVYLASYIDYTAYPTLHPLVQNLYEHTPINGVDPFGYVTKIPSSLNRYEYVATFPFESGCSGNTTNVDYDDVKGNVHFITIAGNSYNPTEYIHPFTPGATSQDVTSGFSTQASYYVLDPSGSSVLYGTAITPENFGFCFYFLSMVVSDEGESYIAFQNDTESMITPSYYDAESGTQKFVHDDSFNSTGDNDITLMVFHDVVPNDNTITDFAPGNNTFCVGGLIYQNPNDGPVLGDEVSYQSGDGSSANHNLPDYILNGTTYSHPSPPASDVTYQWQVSRDGGTTWEDIPGENLAVLKPAPETTPGTVMYRRNVISVACGTLLSTSNSATATIVGDFNLQINLPDEVTYYCPGTAKDLGITITGASGPISWQWYNGFAPLSNDEINPASGSGLEGDFIAEIPTAQNEDGFYRLVVTDANDCKREIGVTIARLTADAAAEPTLALCPGDGGDAVVLGPAAVNPLFDYSWTGPGGFTSSEANPEVSVAGDYFLQVKLTTDPTFCVAGETTVNVPAPTPHDPALTAMPGFEFCQGDSPGPIGLAGPAPLGYVFQWSPGINIDDQQAFNPIFDPGTLPFDVRPVDEIEYTFTALRLSDGCIFETTTMVSDTALALANAGNDRALCGGTMTTFGRVETTGLHWQWEAVSTTYTGGLPALTTDPGYTIDGVNTTLGTNKFADITVPAAVGACYEVTYVLRASYVPFPTNCFATDTVVLFVCPPNECLPCPTVVSEYEGDNGICGGDNTVITATSFNNYELEWFTYSVNGVVQAPGTEPRGLFVNNGGVKGASLAPVGPHTGDVIADPADAAWGWPGANFVVYQVRSYGFIGNDFVDCSELVQVFAGQVATPVIGVIDNSLCVVTEGTPLTITDGVPYTISGVDYTQAPNTGFEWEWSNLAGEPNDPSITADGDTPFPTLNPVDDFQYVVRARDPLTGCIARDTMLLEVIPVVADAGGDVDAYCAGALVQLGTPEQANHTYTWSPTAGLNSPIGTPNSMVAEPYLVVPNSAGSITYTVTVTETTTGCQATDDLIVTPNTDPPTAMADQSIDACGGVSTSVDFGAEVGHTYSWSVVSGGGDLAWFSDVNVANPTITVPMGTPPGTFVFEITKDKANCGLTTALLTITTNNVSVTALSNQSDVACTSGGLETAGWPIQTGATYSWSVFSGGGSLAWFESTDTRFASVNVPAGLTPGDYVFQITKTLGDCGSTTALYTITVLPDIVPDFPAMVTANCTAPLVEISNASHTSGLTYAWEPIEGLYRNSSGTTPVTSTNFRFDHPIYAEVPVGGGSKTYTVTIRDNSTRCVSAPVTVVVNSPTPIIVDAGPNQLYCFGGSAVNIGGTSTGTTYQWTAIGYVNDVNGTPTTPSAAQQTIMLGYLGNTMASMTTFSQTTFAPGLYQYQLESTDAGCTITDMVIVRVGGVPTGLAGTSKQTCAGDPVQIGATSAGIGYTYQWSALSPATEGFTIDNPNILNTTVRPVVTTTYRLVITNSATGCQDIQTVTVGVTPAPQVADVDMPVECAPVTPLDLTAQIPSYATYFNPVWYINSVPGTVLATPTSVMPNLTTNYYLVVENAQGCTDTARVTLNVDNPQTPIILSMVTATCPSELIDLVDFQGSPSQVGHSLEWHSADNTDLSTLITNTMVGAGTYYLFETTANGCVSASDNLIVSAAACPVAVGNFVFMDNNDNGTFEAGTDMGLEGVTLQLYAPGANPGIDAPISTTTTDVDGYYYFDNLPPGMYFIHIPASNFGAGQPLENKESYAGADGTDTVDGNDNGIDTPVNGGISSNTFTLTSDNEPEGEDQTAYPGDLDDDNVNGTIDFTFQCTDISVTLNDPANECIADDNDMSFVATPAPTTGTTGVFSTTATAGLTDNGDGTATLDISAAGVGTYDVTYTYTTANGCTGTETVSVSIIAEPIITLNDPADACTDGTDMSFTATPSGGTFSTTAKAGFTPNNAAGTASLDVSVAGAGTYTVTYDYTDANGCDAAQTVNVEIFAAPVVTVADPSTICSTQTIDLTQGASITPASLGGFWSTPDGTGTFMDAGGLAIAAPYTFDVAAIYIPSTTDVKRGSVTLILTTNDPIGACTVTSNMVRFEILKVDCGSFLWDGSND